jgi:DNA-binding NarL/FixJ family response regulator
MTGKTKILIVEDEIIIANDLQQILIKENYNVCGIANSYDEAVKLFCQEHPQIVMCDIYLKGEKTGIDFVNRINHLNNIPIVFITAFSSDELLSKIADKNHVSYITKPFTNSQVVAAVNLAKYRIKATPKTADMTIRQEEIALLIREGVVANKAIGSRLGISPQTVKSHKKKLFELFDVNTTADLIKAIALLYS